MARTPSNLFLLGGLLLIAVPAQAQDVQTWHGRADGASETEARARAKVDAFDQIDKFRPLQIVSEGQGKCDSLSPVNWTCEYDINFVRTSNPSLTFGN